MAPTVKVTEGEAPFAVPAAGKACTTWYRVVGDLASGRTPLVVVHGGPGLSYDYMAPLADLASPPWNIPVVFYDQLGNGNSTHLREKPKDFWTPQLFMDELDNLVAKLGIAEKYDLLGHSYSGPSPSIIKRHG